MTIQQAYRQLHAALCDVYDEREAANIASLVIENVTGFKKIDRIMNKDVQLSDVQCELLNSHTHKLLRHMPLQYVTNEAWFRGMKFYVNEHVLIPRPETEELVEWIVNDHKEQMRAASILPFSIIDIGTGSGCIPVSLKKKLPSAKVSAIDVSAGAIDIATSNAISNGADVSFSRIDFLDATARNTLGKFDIIVSNPPYVKLNEKEMMNRNVLEYEPHLALFVPDDDALLFYKTILDFSKDHLAPNGSVYLEINEELGQQVVDLFSSYFTSVVLKKDLQGKDRMVRCG